MFIKRHFALDRVKLIKQFFSSIYSLYHYVIGQNISGVKWTLALVYISPNLPNMVMS